MAALALRHFDVLDYVEKSTAMGVGENIAKHQARQFEQIFDAVIATKVETEGQELSTKQDIKELELTTKQNIKELELTTRQDIKELELTTKQEIKEIELKIEQVKADLELKIEKARGEIQKSKVETLLWIAGMFMASGLIQHFFK